MSLYKMFNRNKEDKLLEGQFIIRIVGIDDNGNESIENINVEYKSYRLNHRVARDLRNKVAIENHMEIDFSSAINDVDEKGDKQTNKKAAAKAIKKINLASWNEAKSSVLSELAKYCFGLGDIKYADIPDSDMQQLIAYVQKKDPLKIRNLEKIAKDKKKLTADSL